MIIKESRQICLRDNHLSFLHYVILFFSIFIFSVNASASEDWGYAHNFLIQKKLNTKWSIVSKSQFNARDDMREIFLGLVDLGVDYQLYDWLKIGGAYRGAWSLLRNNEYGYENRPMINIYASKNLHQYFVSNLARFEFRQFNYDLKDDVRFRNEIRVVFPVEITKMKLKPYIEEEFFYSINAEEINANWLSAGLQYQVNKNVRIKTGYRWLRQKAGETWFGRDVLVTGFMFSF